MRLACTGGRELIDGMEYVSLAGGLLLTDAEILSGLIEGGATLHSVASVDSGYARANNERDVAALTQLGALLAPAALTAYDSVASYVARNASARRASLVVASDPSTDMARILKRFASAVLRDGGVACLLLNGGEMGASMRAWRRVPAMPSPSPPAPPPPHDADRGVDDLAAHLAASDAALGLQEVQVLLTPPRDGHAANLSEGERRLRGLFDRDALEDFWASRRPPGGG